MTRTDPMYAPIKQEYQVMNMESLLQIKDQSAKDQSFDKDQVKDPQEVKENATIKVKDTRDARDSTHPNKKQKLRGQNKSRHIQKSFDSIQLCHATVEGKECIRDVCKFSHDVQAYLDSKEPDIGPECQLFNVFGVCKFGIKCRFAKHHTDKDGNQIQSPKPDALQNLNVMDIEFLKSIRNRNTLDALPRSKEFDLWLKEKKKVPLPPIKEVSTLSQDIETPTSNVLGLSTDTPNAPIETSKTIEINQEMAKIKKQDTEESLDLTIPEKKQINFKGKTYLAPLTTVGNLPFRRICKGFGVDITCGEMALCHSLLGGNRSEWALLRRHPSEDIFGVQIAGHLSLPLAQTTELISNHCNVDFIDLNLGCPVELVTKQGSGSALLERKTRLSEILTGMNAVSQIPITVKLRTGISSKQVAHNLIPIFKQSNVSLLTLHGRSKEQRYTKLADWNYISECANLAHQDPFVPMFGNGDVLGWEDYYQGLETGVDGIMIGRGALIKPWIFKEIKERKVYDISSSERLDILKDFCHFGLEHWGSDTIGVNQTRRYLCEWLSFLHRYIPVGLLEVLPQKMNQKPPAYYGRNDLETLMASSQSQDWVKISEMLLGPAPDSFVFIPKHKSNSYSVGSEI